MSANICRLFLFLVFVISSVKPSEYIFKYGLDCSELCRDGCPSVSLCENSKENVCYCRSSSDLQESSNNNGGERSGSGTQYTGTLERENSDETDDLYSSPNSGSSLTTIFAIIVLIITAVLLTVVSINWCIKYSNKDSDAFSKAHKLPNLQLNMALKQADPLGTNRQSKHLPRGNGYVDQMHLYPIAPGQHRGPMPGFINPTFPPSYTPL